MDDPEGELKCFLSAKKTPRCLTIVVPGAGTLHPEHWTGSDGRNWLQSQLAPSIPLDEQAVWVFDNTLYHDRKLAWNRIQSEGGGLLLGLRKLLDSPDLKQCPVVLISHSLGGLLVRRAICLANKRKELSTLHLACVVLISCPFSTSPDPEDWRSLLLISKTYPKFYFGDEMSTALTEVLAEDCSGFQKAISSYPVVSVYETKDTQLGRYAWNHQLFVDEDNVRLDAKSETNVGIAEDHNHSCCLSRSHTALRTVRSIIDRAVLGDKTHSKANADDDRAESMSRTSMKQRDKVRAKVDSSVATRGSRSDRTGSPDPVTQRLRDAEPVVADHRSKPRLPIFMVPYSQNNQFQGRKEYLDNMANHLLPRQHVKADADKSGKVSAYTLYGSGGFGKTQTATEYVHRYRHKYDAIFWIPCDNAAKIAQTFNEIALALGLVEPDSVSARDKTWTLALVMSWLSNPIFTPEDDDTRSVAQADWLLVFDNVDDPKILDDVWPRASYGAVLITSRNPSSATELFFETESRQMKPFDETETAALLLKLTKRSENKHDKANAALLAGLLGGIPLAIFVIAGVIVKESLAFEEIIKDYEEDLSRQNLLHKSLEGFQAQNYQYTLSSVWHFTGLGDAAYLLDVLAFLDPDGIPEFILTNDSARTEIEGFPQTTEQYKKARSVLIETSLASRNRDTKELAIHRLITDAARDRMDDIRYSEVYTSALQLIHACWPYQDAPAFRNENSRWGLSEVLYKHILCLVRHAKSPKRDPPRKLSAQHLAPPKVLLEAAWYSLMQSKYEETADILEVVESTFAPLLSDSSAQKDMDQKTANDFEEQVKLLHFCPGALALMTSGDGRKSLKEMKTFKALAIEKIKARPQGQDQSLGVAFNEVGNAYLQNNSAVQAEECFWLSIEALEATEGASAHTVTMPQINLGFAMWIQSKLARGNHDEVELKRKEKLEDAVSVFERARSHRARAYGKNDKMSFALAKLLLGYGHVKKDQGDLGLSFEMHKECVQQCHDSVGRYHHRTADASVVLAWHYIRKRDASNARYYLLEAHTVFGDREVYRAERARMWFLQWQLERSQNQNDAAENARKKAIELYRQKHKDDDRELEDLTDADFDNDLIFWSR